MIRRSAADGWILIRQPDHARLAGRIAERWRGFVSDAGSDKQQVLDAVSFHDEGWAAEDALPSLNDQGMPRDVLETPIEVSVRIWGASTEKAAQERSPLTALLVSLHQLRLSDLVQSRASTSGERFALNKFQHRQVEIQEELRRRLGYATDSPLRLGLAMDSDDARETKLAEYFALLWTCDFLSLQLCRGSLLPGGGRTGLAQRYEFLTDSVMAVDPWPFVGDEIAESVLGHCVSRRAFSSEGEFRLDFANAQAEGVGLRLVRWVRE
jgi:hypothetical protein